MQIATIVQLGEPVREREREGKKRKGWQGSSGVSVVQGGSPDNRAMVPQAATGSSCVEEGAHCPKEKTD